jgi:hypothetical protein
MDDNQCKVRAAACAANAMEAVDEAVSQEFLKLAAQWRAMAARTIMLGTAEELAACAPLANLAAPAPRPVYPMAPNSK